MVCLSLWAPQLVWWFQRSRGWRVSDTLELPWSFALAWHLWAFSAILKFQWLWRGQCKALFQWLAILAVWSMTAWSHIWKPSGSKTSLHIIRGRHVWPLCVGLCLLCHLLLQSTSHPYIGLHSLCTSPRMEQSHFAWFFGRKLVHCTFWSTLLPEYKFHGMSGWPLYAGLLLQVGYCYIHA